jgi:carbonic anhydrase
VAIRRTDLVTTTLPEKLPSICSLTGWVPACCAAKLPALQFAYKSGPINLINNGYVAVRVDYAPGNGNVMTVGGICTQFHFHHPGEEQIDGKSYDMVLHLMH